MASTFDPDQERARLARLVESHLNHISQQIAAEIEVELGSPAAAEQANEETGPGGPWGDEPPHTALSLGKLKLSAAADHIGSLHKLLQPPLPLFGLTVMVRVAVETSGKAFWLLDPNIGVRERVARQLGDRLVSAEEEREALKMIQGDEFEDRGEFDAVTTEAAELGVTPHRPPKYATLVGRVLAEHMPQPRAVGVYMYWSAVVHNVNYATLQHFEEIGPAKDQRSQLVRGILPFEGVWSSVAATLAAHTTAIEAMLDYLGRDKWAWDRWKNKIAQDLTTSSSTFQTGMIRRVGRPKAGGSQ